MVHKGNSVHTLAQLAAQFHLWQCHKNSSHLDGHGCLWLPFSLHVLVTVRPCPLYSGPVIVLALAEKILQLLPV